MNVCVRFPRVASVLALVLSNLVLSPIASAQTAPPASVSTEEAIKLPVFQVNDKNDVGYQAGNTISATRLDTPVYKVPFSVNVATEDFIRDIGTTDFQSTIRFLNSVERSFSPVSYGQYFIRGVSLGTRGQFLDSRPILNGVGDNFSIDRVEVLKGPASPVAGIATPVGMINFITKQAQVQRRFENLSFKFGSHHYARGVFDVNLPYTIFGDKAAIRIMGVDHSAESDVPFEAARHRGVTIATANRFGPTLTVTTSAQVLSLNRIHTGQLAEASSNNPGARGYSNGGWDPNLLDSNGRTIPASRTAPGNPGFTTGMLVKDLYDLRQLAGIAGPDNGQFFTEVNLQQTLALQATDKLWFELYNSAGRENKEDPRTLGTTAIAFSGVTVTNNVPVLNPAGGRYYEIQVASAFHYPPLWRFYHRGSAAYTLDTKWTQQIFRAGMDVQWQTNRQQQTMRIRRPGTATDLALNTYLDQPITAETTGYARFFNAGGAWVATANSKLPRETEVGLFITAQGSYLNDRIHTVIGTRHDTYFYRSWQAYTIPVGKKPTDDPLIPLDALRQRSDSPVYSISAEPLKGINFYYTRAYSFSVAAVGSPILNYKGTVNDNPSTAVAQGLFDASNPRGPLPPSPTGMGDEVGVKLLLLDNRVSATFATYKDHLKNIRASWPSAFIVQLFGPNNPNTSIPWSAGGVEQLAKGWETAVQANPTRNLTLSADFSYSNIAFVTNPINPAAVGQQQAGYYKKMANGLARYTVGSGQLKGLFAGGAVQYRGSLFVNSAPNIKNPDYTVYNPFVGYGWKVSDRMTADVRLDIVNLFDKFYVSQNIIGLGRSVFLSVDLHFK